MCDGQCGITRDGTRAGTLADQAEPPTGGGGLVSGYTRRDFIARSTAAAAAALALAACGDGTFGGDITGLGSTPLGNGTFTINLSDYPSLAAVGGIAAVSLPGGGRIGVGRTGADTFAGYGLACTHAGTTVQVSGSEWYCPNHGAIFDEAGGVVRGPASRPLVAIATTYDGAAGTLTFNGVDPSTPPTGSGGGDDDDHDDDDDHGDGDDD